MLIGSDDSINNDASVGIGVDLGVASVSSLTYIFNSGADIELDQEVGLSASLAGLSVTDTFQLVDILVGDLSFTNMLEVSYTMGGIMPFASWMYYSPDSGPDVGDVTAGVELSGFVENTVFTLTYEVEDVAAGNNGLITFAGKISY